MVVRELRTIVAAALVLTASACTTSGATRTQTGVASTSTPPATTPAGIVVELSLRTGEVLREFTVGPDPLVAVEAGLAIWTLNLDDGTVSRIDPETGEIREAFDGNVAGIVADPGAAVWGAVDGRWLVRIDATTGRTLRRLEIAEEPVFGVRDAGWPAVGGGWLWLTVPEGRSGEDELWRIDPEDGRIDARVSIPSNPLPVVFLRGAVWISHEEGVLRVDARTLERRLVAVGPFPGVAALGRDGIWVPVSGGADRLDPATGTVREELRFPVSPRGLAVIGPRLWLTTDTGVTIVDRDGTVVRIVELTEPSDDEGPIAIVRLGDSVWVTVETA
ncbi:MAG TPA: hypothetical protein VF235_07585 [Actinomycetota bacterium]